MNNKIVFPEGKSINDFNTTQQTVLACLKTQLYGMAPIVPFVKGPPATGKTDMIKQIAMMFDWDYDEIILSRYSAVELQGLFVPNHGTKMLEHYPLKRITGGDSKKPKLLLFDEITNAEEDVHAAVQSAFQSRVIEGCKIGDNIMFAAAGNGSEDGCNAIDLSRAMLEGRLLTINHYPDVKDWVNNFAIPNEINPYIISYIEWQKESLYKFDPSSMDDAQPTCRGWDKLNAGHKILMMEEPSSSYIRLIKNNKIADNMGGGSVGMAEYEKFKAFVNLADKLPSFASITSAPDGAKLPDGMGEQFGVIANITSELRYLYKEGRTVEDYEVVNICKYLKRMPSEFIGMAVHAIAKVSSQVRDSASFTELITEYTGTSNKY